MLATACMLFSSGFRLGSGLGLDLVSGWLVVMHTYLRYFSLLLSLSYDISNLDQGFAL